MPDNQMMLTTVGLTIIFTVIVAILFLLMKSQKYDQEKHRAMIEEMRDSLRKKYII